MEEIRLTSWYGKYPIIYRVSNIFYFHPHLIREGFPFWRLYTGNGPTHYELRLRIHHQFCWGKKTCI